MKILMLCDFYDESLEYQENLMTRYYLKLGHKVLVIASQQNSIVDYYYNDKTEGSTTIANLKNHPYQLIRLPKYSFIKKFWKFKNFPSLLQNFQPDFIFIHDIHPNISDVIKYKKLNPSVRLKMDCHADLTNSAKNWLSYYVQHKLLKNFLYLRPSLPYLEKIYGIVPASIDFLHKVYNVSLDSMELLPLGADIDAINALKASDFRSTMRSNLGINESDFVIFTGGKLNTLKRTDLLIDSCHILSDQTIHIVVAGVGVPDEDREYYIMLEKKLNSSTHIHRLGWVDTDSIYRWLLESNIAVFPGSQSVLWLKAIACGLPIVIGKMPNQSIDYLNEFGGLIIVDDKDVNAETFASHIFKLKNDDDYYNELSGNARRTGQEMLDWNKLILKTLE